MQFFFSRTDDNLIARVKCYIFPCFVLFCCQFQLKTRTDGAASVWRRPCSHSHERALYDERGKVEPGGCTSKGVVETPFDPLGAKN